MIEYYNDLIKRTSNPIHRSYYEDMIKYLENPKKKIKRKNYKRVSIYVGALHKTFKSARKASLALGHSKTYIYKVLYGHIPNKYNVKEI